MISRSNLTCFLDELDRNVPLLALGICLGLVAILLLGICIVKRVRKHKKTIICWKPKKRLLEVIRKGQEDEVKITRGTKRGTRIIAALKSNEKQVTA